MIDPHGQRLAKAIAAGDRGAFEELFEHFFSRVYAYARRRTPSSEVAQRVTEETLRIALEKLPDTDGSVDVNQFVLAILTRVHGRTDGGGQTTLQPAAR